MEENASSTRQMIFKNTMNPIKDIIESHGDETELKPIKHEAYRDFINRKCTFKRWPGAQNPEDLAKAGFFYKGSGRYTDSVQCFCCGITLANWDPDDIPWREHATWAPQCQFLRNVKGIHFVNRITMEVKKSKDLEAYQKACGRIENVQRLQEKAPCDADYIQQLMDMGFNHDLAEKQVKQRKKDGNPFTLDQIIDVLLDDQSFNSNVGNSHVKVTNQANKLKQDACNPTVFSCKAEIHHPIPIMAVQNQSKTQKNDISCGDGKSSPTSGYRFQDYADYDRRLLSFKTWNSQMNKYKMAKAGFIYTGVDDMVRCFACGISLKQWVPGEDPWTEHARLANNCSYLMTIKGSNFINASKHKYRIKSNDVEVDGVDDGEEVVQMHSVDDVDGDILQSVMPAVRLYDDSPPTTPEEVMDNPFKLEAAVKVVDRGFIPKTVASAVQRIIREGKEDWKKITVKDIEQSIENIQTNS